MTSFIKALMLGALPNAWYPSLIPVVPKVWVATLPPAVPRGPKNEKTTTIQTRVIREGVTDLANFAHLTVTGKERPQQEDITYPNASGGLSSLKGPDTVADLQQVRNLLAQQQKLIQQLSTATLPLDAKTIEAKDTVSAFAEWMEPQLYKIGHRMKLEGLGARLEHDHFSTALRFFTKRYNEFQLTQGSTLRFDVEGTVNVEGDADIRVTEKDELLCVVEAKVHLPQDRGAVQLDPTNAHRWQGQVIYQRNHAKKPVITIVLDGDVDGAVARLERIFRPRNEPSQLGLKWALLCVVPVKYPCLSETPTGELRSDYEEFVATRKMEAARKAQERKRAYDREFQAALYAQKKQKQEKTQESI